MGREVGRTKRGVTYASGRQVAMIAAKIKCANLGRREALEFLEYECGVEVARLDDIPANMIDTIVSKFKSTYSV